MKNITITTLFILFTLNSIGQTNIRIMIAGKSGGTLSVKELNEAKIITLNTDTIKITSYNFTSIVNGSVKTINIQGDSISSECYSILNNQIGKKFFIEDVKGILNNGIKVYIGSAAYKISK